MQRQMILFAGGILAASWLPSLPAPGQLWPLLILPALYRLRGVPWLLWPVGGACWLIIYVQLLGPAPLPAQLEGVEIEVRGEIVSIPQATQRRQRFDFRIAQVLQPDIEWPEKIRISWYDPKLNLQAGQHWQLRVKLQRPHGFANPGGFDYEAWVLQHGIAATGYVRQPDRARLLATDTTLHSIRQWLGRQIRQHLQQSPASALIAALVNGDRQYLDENQWRTLSRTGTAHLMAISGLHIGLVYGLWYWLGRWLWSRSARLCLWRPAQDIGVISGLLAALAYAALAGFAIPTQRALIMLGIIGLALLWRRTPAMWPTLLLALNMVLLIDPLAVLSTGFWLSFGAIAIIWYSLRRARQTSRFRQLVVLQFAIALGMLPLYAIFFHQASLVAPLANLLAVPLVSLTVAPLALIGAMLLPIWQGAANLCLGLSAMLLEMLWRILEPLGNSAYAVMHLPQPHPVSLLLAGIGLLWLLHPRSGRYRWGGLLLLPPLLWLTPERPCDGCFRTDVLDVGQGLAVIVRTREHALLYDAGPRMGPGFDAGQRVILPYLRHQGIRQLDTVMISHEDNDHRGGLAAVMAGTHAEELIMEPANAPAEWLHRAIDCRAGRHWQRDGVRFEILYPLTNEPGASDNNRSCVLRVSAGSHSLLLTGDIELSAEQQLVSAYGLRLKSTVLIAPHHGSRTSSGETLLDAVQQHIVVFSAGYRNRFGFPHTDVEARYRARNTRILRTDRQGMLRLEFNPASAQPGISGFRERHRRFWRKTPD